MEVKESIKKLASELGTVKLATDELSSQSDHVYKFDCPPIDIPLGGGIYSGKIYEIFGWESNGKSTFALECTKAFAKYWRSRGFNDYGVLWVESENALDRPRAQYMGCEMDAFLTQEADTVEDCEKIVLSTLEKAQKSKMKLFIVWDTLAAAPTANEKNNPGQWCFTADARVKCLDGKIRTMKEMQEAFDKDEDLWVYSYDVGTKSVVPGKVKWAGVTKKVNELCEVTFDNGESVRCTPDHRFMTRDGKYKEAKDLVDGESLMPLYWEDAPCSWIKNCTNLYEKITSPEEVFTHQMVIRDIPNGSQRHHIDHDRYNNNPDNLTVMAKEDHARYHILEYNKTEENRMRTALRNKDPEFIKMLDKTWAEGRKSGVAEWTKKAHLEKEFGHKSQATQDLITRNKILKRAHQVIQEGLPRTPESYFNKLKRVRGYSVNSINRYFNNDWNSLYKEAETFNHSVKSVRLYKTEPTDMYDITVPGFHNFALELRGSAVFVHQSGGMMEKPRVIKSFLRKITNLLGQTDSTMILVNQPYGGPLQGKFPETVGGNGIKFHASLRLMLTARTPIHRSLPDGKIVQDGIWVEGDQAKNKIIGLKQKFTMCMLNETGIDKFQTVANFLQETKISTIAGSWKKLSIPVSLYKDGEEEPKMTELSYQSYSSLKEKIDSQYPHVHDWMNYLIYDYHTKISPILKVKIIKDVWAYEMQFFGKKKTVLTDKEQDLAESMYKDMVRSVIKEETEVVV